MVCDGLRSLIASDLRSRSVVYHRQEASIMRCDLFQPKFGAKKDKNDHIAHGVPEPFWVDVSDISYFSARGRGKGSLGDRGGGGSLPEGASWSGGCLRGILGG